MFPLRFWAYFLHAFFNEFVIIINAKIKMLKRGCGLYLEFTSLNDLKKKICVFGKAFDVGWFADVVIYV